MSARAATATTPAVLSSPHQQTTVLDPRSRTRAHLGARPPRWRGRGKEGGGAGGRRRAGGVRRRTEARAPPPERARPGDDALRAPPSPAGAPRSPEEPPQLQRERPQDEERPEEDGAGAAPHGMRDDGRGGGRSEEANANRERERTRGSLQFPSLERLLDIGNEGANLLKKGLLRSKILSEYLCTIHVRI